jgi:hypothetical protein
LQFKGTKKPFLFIGVVGFKYITRNQVGEYEILYWDSSTKEIFKLEILL